MKQNHAGGIGVAANRWRIDFRLCGFLTPLSIGVLLLIVLTTAWRFVDLDRDPPIITTSDDGWIDPGHYLYNARSYSLFHEWRGDEGSALYVTPGYTFLAVFWFSLFGCGYEQAVLLTLLAGFVVMISASLIAGFSASLAPCRHLLAGNGVILSLLLSYTFFARQYVPKGDMESIAVASLAALALTRLQSDPPGSGRFRVLALASGLGIGLAPFIKVYSAIFSAAALTAWLASYPALGPDWRRAWRRATPFVASGLLLSISVWVGWIFWLRRMGLTSNLSTQWKWYMRTIVPSLAGVVIGAANGGSFAFSSTKFLQTNFFYRQPVETLLASLSLAIWVLKEKRNWPLFLCSLWMLSGVVAMSFMAFAPLRYRVLFWPPFVVLAASAWTDMMTGMVERLSPSREALGQIFVAFVLGYGAGYALRVRVGGTAHELSSAQFGVLVGALSLVLFPIVRFAMRHLSHRRMAIFLAVTLLVWSVPQWWKGETLVSHELRDAARVIEGRYPGAVLGEWGGAELALWTKLEAYLQWSPAAIRRVTLIIDVPAVAAKVPVQWQPVGVIRLKRIKAEYPVWRVVR